MKIRKATIKDIPQIVRLLHKYDLYENNLDKRHKIDSIKEITLFNKKVIKNENVVFLVLESNNKLEGVIRGEDRITAIGKQAIFHVFFISEEARGKGYGKRMLKELISYFKKRGCNQIKSFVYINNKRSLKFYKELGFKYEEGYSISKKLRGYN